mmetsp:Transcript_45949/g.71988  ORF Transcript_45949/g.71988 Transcript_45949/m.71988 type:complete len:88 (+) Transcript_45949:122-385(+)
MPLFLPFRGLVCKSTADADYSGRGTQPEETAFGIFDGCTFTPAEEYPPATFGGAEQYPPDGPSPCSPNCYHTDPGSIRGKSVIVAFL